MLLRLTPVDQFGQGEWRFLGREPQQGLACRHRRMASVDAHDTPVQIALELLRLNAVMRAVEPSLGRVRQDVATTDRPGIVQGRTPYPAGPFAACARFILRGETFDRACGLLAPR